MQEPDPSPRDTISDCVKGADRDTGDSRSEATNCVIKNKDQLPRATKPKKRKRCTVCRSKALTNMVCKCGVVVCLTHRYPDSHRCTFDQRSEDLMRLQKAMPAVAPPKLESF